MSDEVCFLVKILFQLLKVIEKIHSHWKVVARETNLHHVNVGLPLNEQDLTFFKTRELI